MFSPVPIRLLARIRQEFSRVSITRSGVGSVTDQAKGNEPALTLQSSETQFDMHELVECLERKAPALR